MSATPKHPTAPDGRGAHSLYRLVGLLLARRDRWNQLAETARDFSVRSRCRGYADGIEWAASEIALEWPEQPNVRGERRG
jgi:hypothetical protein